MKHLLMIGLLLVGSAAFAQETQTQEERIEQGDVLLMEKVQRSEDAPVPQHGLKMAQVEQQYGEPITRVPPVGDPPITRWVYDGFTVYFEHDTVIHAVADRETVS